MVKASAYCLSIVGLAFLAVAAWLQASHEGVRLAIVGGSLCSLAGLAARLYNHCCEGRSTKSKVAGPRIDLANDHVVIMSEPSFPARDAWTKRS